MTKAKKKDTHKYLTIYMSCDDLIYVGVYHNLAKVSSTSHITILSDASKNSILLYSNIIKQFFNKYALSWDGQVTDYNKTKVKNFNKIENVLDIPNYYFKKFMKNVNGDNHNYFETNPATFAYAAILKNSSASIFNDFLNTYNAAIKTLRLISFLEGYNVTDMSLLKSVSDRLYHNSIEIN